MNAEGSINQSMLHVVACKKLGADLREELLFKQPESTHLGLGDCPICCLPLPLEISKSSIYGCCSKEICLGCACANIMREAEESLDPSCPFCRKPLLGTEEEHDKQRMKRVEANDPVALRREGLERYKKGDYKRGFEYCTKAAELGDADAHCKLAVMYQVGRGVEEDEGKSMYHLEEAAIRGHPEARYHLGAHELENGNIDRAVKHFVIAATQGDDVSIKALMEMFKEGFVRKVELADALRAHQAAVDATKSPQRDAADEFKKSRLERGD